MFWQYCLGNKKPTFLACNTEQVYAAILDLQKLKECSDESLSLFWKNACMKIRNFCNEITEICFFYF